MTRLPISYTKGRDLIMHSYYGNFIYHVAKTNHLNGMYGLTGTMLSDALNEYGAYLGNEDLVFEDDKMSTVFMLRWSNAS